MYEKELGYTRRKINENGGLYDKIKLMIRTNYFRTKMASKFDLGHMKMVEHEIRCNNRSNAQDPRRVTMHLKRKIVEMVKSLLKVAIIHKCIPVTFPLVIIGKRFLKRNRRCHFYITKSYIVSTKVFPYLHTMLKSCIWSYTKLRWYLRQHSSTNDSKTK